MPPYTSPAGSISLASCDGCRPVKPASVPETDQGPGRSALRDLPTIQITRWLTMGQLIDRIRSSGGTAVISHHRTRWLAVAPDPADPGEPELRVSQLLTRTVTR